MNRCLDSRLCLAYLLFVASVLLVLSQPQNDFRRIKSYMEFTMANKALDITSISRFAMSEGVSFTEARQALREAAKPPKGQAQTVKEHNRKAREDHYGSLFVAIKTSNGNGEEIFQVKGRFQNKRALQAEQAISFVQSLDSKARKGLDLNKVRAFWVKEDTFINL